MYVYLMYLQKLPQIGPKIVCLFAVLADSTMENATLTKRSSKDRNEIELIYSETTPQ
jgi:hypothetical protein